MFRRLSYLDVLNREPEVMDSTAISLCRDNNLPILVFNMTKPGNIRRVVLGEPLGTLVLDERREPRIGAAPTPVDMRRSVPMVNDIIKNLQGDIDKAIEAFKRELGKVRTGRANLAILDGVRVDYYGTPTPLNQVASLNVRRRAPHHHQAVGAVADPRDREGDPRGAAGPEPAVRRRAGAPAHAGADRRSGARSWSRWSRRWPRRPRSPCAAARRDANEMLKEALKDKAHHRGRRAQGPKSVQETTDKAVAKVDEIVTKKEAEILEV